MRKKSFTNTTPDPDDLHIRQSDIDSGKFVRRYRNADGSISGLGVALIPDMIEPPATQSLPPQVPPHF